MGKDELGAFPGWHSLQFIELLQNPEPLARAIKARQGQRTKGSGADELKKKIVREAEDPAPFTEEERRNLKRAGYNMPDWDPMQWLGCGSCQADHSDMDEQRGGSGELKSPA